ncbi:MAG: hypothetical protein GIW95_09580 [Candidatus Eremiobacteraeota bacterium]|nr:hypothetical protein [Candidatus Eremiobacteraeota bacterium]
MVLSRGQTLVEALLAMAVLAAALGLIASALARASASERAQTPANRIALEAATNAGTEAIAATEFDATALSKIANARWTSRDGIALDAVVAPAGDARKVVLRFVDANGARRELPVTLRQLALPPDALVDLTAPGR